MTEASRKPQTSREALEAWKAEFGVDRSHAGFLAGAKWARTQALEEAAQAAELEDESLALDTTLGWRIADAIRSLKDQK